MCVAGGGGKEGWLAVPGEGEASTSKCSQGGGMRRKGEHASSKKNKMMKILFVVC